MCSTWPSRRQGNRSNKTPTVCLLLCADRRQAQGRNRVGGLKKQESGMATGRSGEWGTDP